MCGINNYLRKLLFCLFFIVSTAGAATAAEPSGAEGKNENKACTVIRWDKTVSSFPYLSISSPGKYCLDQDYQTTCYPAIGRCSSTDLVVIRANDVVLDLRGHTLAASGRPIRIYGYGNNINIRNGIIKNGSILLRGIDTPDYISLHNAAPWVEPDFYADNSLSVERIKIESGAIELYGANSLIRENEVLARENALAAISVYGPNSVIEDNGIRIRTSGSKKRAAYGVFARAAKNLIIRRNDFQNDEAAQNAFSIGLKNSGDVFLEKNSFGDFESNVEEIGESSTKGQAVTIRARR